MADLWSTSRLLLTVFSGILCQLFSVSATLRVLNNVTWDTAVYACHERGEHLYNTADITLLSDVTAGSYWIGAKVQFSSWMWTADNTPLFRSLGEVNEFTSSKVYEIKYDNQASQCYYECKQDKTTASVTYVGLQGAKCYCLNYGNQISHQFVLRQNKTGCLGNFKENCGTENTISVYKTDITVDLDIHGMCGYFEQDAYRLIIKTEENCLIKKGFICNCPGEYSNKSCYNHYMTHSWFSSNSSCVLAKRNSSNTETIRQPLWPNRKYWIGLKRDKEIVWTDSHFKNETLNINITQNGCLLLEKSSSGKISFSISNCSTHHFAVCINNFSFQTSTQTDRFTTQTDSSSTQAPFISETTINSGQTRITQRVLSKRRETSNSDVAVGVSVTVVILLVVCTVVAVVCMKRKNVFCFQQKSADVAHNNSNNSETTTTVTETNNSAISDSNYERLNMTQNSQNEYMNVPRETEHVYCVMRSNVED